MCKLVMKFKLRLNLKTLFSEYKRIMKIAKKPSKDEFMRISKISLIGMVVMGAIGFIIQILYRLVIQ